MRSPLPFIIVGITTGSVYALAAVGLVLTFKTSGIFNFAHGAQAAVAAFVFFELSQRNSIPWPLAGLVTLVVVGIVGGLILERLAAGLAGATTAARVAATVGLLVATQAELENIFGTQPLRMPFYLPTHPLRLPGVTIRTDQIIVTLLALGATAGLYWFLSTRRLGAAMQAAIDNPELLSAKGISPVTMRRYAWVIGSCFATVSGMLLAPITGLNSSVLTLLVFYAFGAAAIGMFNSIPLTYAGGIGIGVLASVMTGYITSGGAISRLPSTLPFLVLFLALALTPKGRLRERGLEAVRRPPPRPIRLQTARSRVVAGIGLAGLLLVPHVVGPAKVSVYANALGFLVIFASLALLVRVSGQISLCQMTFAAVGAATFGHAIEAGFPWVLAVLAGGLAAIPAGAVVAIPSFRLSGLYLAMATFGFGLLVRDVFFRTTIMFGDFTHTLPAPRPEIGIVDLGSDKGYYHVALAIALACLLLVLAVSGSRLGRLLRGMADAPAAVDAHGANTNVSKFLVFCISAFVAGTGGAMVSPVTGSISAPAYEFSISLVLVAVLFIAGRHPVSAPFIASALYILVPAYITNTTVQRYIPVAFGATAVLAAMLPGLHLGERLRTSTRVRERLGRSPVRARQGQLEEAVA